MKKPTQISLKRKGNKNAFGFGCIRAASGRGGVVRSRSAQDRRRSATVAPADTIVCAKPREVPDVASVVVTRDLVIETGHGAVRDVLDGEVVITKFGYDSLTQERRMHVPHTVARDAAEALAVCQQQGIVLAKMANMTQEAAFYVFATTLAKRILPC